MGLEMSISSGQKYIVVTAEQNDVANYGKLEMQSVKANLIICSFIHYSIMLTDFFHQMRPLKAFWDDLFGKVMTIRS